MECAFITGFITYFNNTAKYPPGYVVQNYNFDWFHYAGIHRPVYLYTVPKTAYVDDINITCTLPNANTGIVDYIIILTIRKLYLMAFHLAFVSYGVGLKGSDTSIAAIDLKLYDQDGTVVTQSTSAPANGLLVVSNLHLWWPQGMNAQVAYLHTLQVNFFKFPRFSNQDHFSQPA